VLRFLQRLSALELLSSHYYGDPACAGVRFIFPEEMALVVLAFAAPVFELSDFWVHGTNALLF
jgi:hypothetical protein